MEEKKRKMDFLTQTYFRTRLEREADRKNDKTALQVNCTGAVSSHAVFSNRSVRQDYYYLYLLQGGLMMEDFTLLPGDVIILEPGRPYQYESLEDTSYLWVHFTGFEARSLAKTALEQTNARHSIGIHEEILLVFKRLFAEFLAHDSQADALAVCLLREILLLTGRFSDKMLPENRPLKALSYIHSHFHEPISMEKLASLEHISATSLRTAFHRHTGMSPNEYLILQRINFSCRLLTQTDLDIRSIASQAGYPDPYYFSRIFKEKTGLAPSEYRRQYSLT